MKPVLQIVHLAVQVQSVQFARLVTNCKMVPVLLAQVENFTILQHLPVNHVQQTVLPVVQVQIVKFASLVTNF